MTQFLANESSARYSLARLRVSTRKPEMYGHGPEGKLLVSYDAATDVWKLISALSCLLHAVRPKYGVAVHFGRQMPSVRSGLLT